LIIPAGMVVISMIIMCFYNLDKIYSKIRAEINARNIEKEETIEDSKMVKNA
jgi:Na+/melibiose symporter-like transporter